MSNKRFYGLSANDSPVSLWVFCKSPAPNVYPTLRQEFAPLKCEACERVEPWRAIVDVGIPNDVVPPIKRDFQKSSDLQTVVSRRFREVTESVPDAEAYFFPLPAAPDYFIMYPKHLTEAPDCTEASEEMLAPPNPEIPFAVISDVCPVCGARSTRFWDRFFRVPEDWTLGAAKMTVKGWQSTFWWIVSKPLALALKKAQLTGLTIRADEYLN